MSYCDMCDRNPVETEAYDVDGFIYNWCFECVDEFGVL